MCGECTHLSVEHTLAGVSPAVVALSLTCCENREVCAMKCTHPSVEHTLAGASPAIVVLSLTCCNNRDVCDLKFTHLSVEHTLTGASPERVLFIGTQFSILYTSMYSPAEAATPRA